MWLDDVFFCMNRYVALSDLLGQVTEIDPSLTRTASIDVYAAAAAVSDHDKKLDDDHDDDAVVAAAGEGDRVPRPAPVRPHPSVAPGPVRPAAYVAPAVPVSSAAPTTAFFRPSPATEPLLSRVGLQLPSEDEGPSSLA